MMLAARNVALRVSGSCVTQGRVHVREKGPQLIVTVSPLGDFVVDEDFTLEILELLHSPEMRERLPNGGWRNVSLRMLLALVRGGVVLIA